MVSVGPDARFQRLAGEILEISRVCVVQLSSAHCVAERLSPGREKRLPRSSTYGRETLFAYCRNAQYQAMRNYVPTLGDPSFKRRILPIFQQLFGIPLAFIAAAADAVAGAAMPREASCGIFCWECEYSIAVTAARKGGVYESLGTWQ